MSQLQVNPKAAQAAKLYLEMRRYKIIEQNWRQSKEHIDIIASKDDTIYFVNVHYRADNTLSPGQVTALSPSKLRAHQRAAEGWTIGQKWRGAYALALVEIGDPDYAVISFADNIN
jgi:Holliday junction resolvase-like predicted endonuclease